MDIHDGGNLARVSRCWLDLERRCGTEPIQRQIAAIATVQGWVGGSDRTSGEQDDH